MKTCGSGDIERQVNNTPACNYRYEHKKTATDT